MYEDLSTNYEKKNVKSACDDQLTPEEEKAIIAKKLYAESMEWGQSCGGKLNSKCKDLESLGKEDAYYEKLKDFEIVDKEGINKKFDKYSDEAAIIKKKMLAEKEGGFCDDDAAIVKKKLADAGEGKFSEGDEAAIIKKKMLAEKEGGFYNDDAAIVKKKLANAGEGQISEGDEAAIIKKKMLAEKEGNFKEFDKDEEAAILKKKLQTEGKEVYKQFDKEGINKKLDKDFSQEDIINKKLSGKDIYGVSANDVLEKQPNKISEKDNWEDVQRMRNENERMQQLSDNMGRSLRSGSFGDNDCRQAMAENFQLLARNAGRQGEQDLLNKINRGLQGDGSQYHLQFGQNHIKTPGGRRLEIVDSQGRVTDRIDFVVPNQEQAIRSSQPVYKNSVESQSRW